MVSKINFPLGNQSLFLTTLKELSKKDIEDLEFLIETFSIELNHHITDSSAWRFNTGQAQIGIYFQPEFIQYFNFVYTLFKSYPDTFNPFSVSALSEGQIEIDEDEKMIVKNIDFEFDTSYFRNIFIMEYISEYLREAVINEFLIELDENYIAQGEKGWLIRNEGLQYNLINASAINFRYDPSGFKSHKFGAIDNDLQPSPAFVIGEDLGSLKILTPQINYVNTITDLTKFSEENNVEIILQK